MQPHGVLFANGKRSSGGEIEVRDDISRSRVNGAVFDFGTVVGLYAPCPTAEPAGIPSFERIMLRREAPSYRIAPNVGVEQFKIGTFVPYGVHGATCAVTGAAPDGMIAPPNIGVGMECGVTEALSDLIDDGMLFLFV